MHKVPGGTKMNVMQSLPSESLPLNARDERVCCHHLHFVLLSLPPLL